MPSHGRSSCPTRLWRPPRSRPTENGPPSSPTNPATTKSTLHLSPPRTLPGPCHASPTEADRTRCGRATGASCSSRTRRGEGVRSAGDRTGFEGAGVVDRARGSVRRVAGWESVCVRTGTSGSRGRLGDTCGVGLVFGVGVRGAWPSSERRRGAQADGHESPRRRAERSVPAQRAARAVGSAGVAIAAGRRRDWIQRAGPRSGPRPVSCATPSRFRPAVSIVQ